MGQTIEQRSGHLGVREALGRGRVRGRAIRDGGKPPWERAQWSYKRTDQERIRPLRSWGRPPG